MKKLLALLTLALGLSTAAFAGESASLGRCFCRPYTGLGPQGHELIYIDSDGIQRFIYAYSTYAGCLEGLNNTLLCR